LTSETIVEVPDENSRLGHKVKYKKSPSPISHGTGKRFGTTIGLED
jgi:hypothetical protein